MVNFKSPPGALRVQENDIQKNYDGGRIVLVGDNGEQAKTPGNPSGTQLSKEFDLGQITVMLNYLADEPMRDWPEKRAEIAARRFTLHITEEKPAK